MRAIHAQRRRAAVLLAGLGVGLMSAAGANPAAAESVLDANCPGPGNTASASDGNTRAAQTFTAQATGSLTRGEVLIQKAAANTPGDFVLKIVTADATGTPTNTSLAGTVIPDATVPNGVSTLTGQFAPPASVTAGQSYAIVVTRPGSNTLATPEHNDNPCPGAEFSSLSQAGSWTLVNSTYDLIFAVFVEPLEVPDTTAPETTITKAPKHKTKKRTATFEFASNEPGATFECSLDGEAFAPCTSPESEKVKRGKHSFQVRARDQVGNTDLTPAGDDWRVKRKK